MLFIDFIYSQETQKEYFALGYSTARTDIEDPTQPPDEFYLLSEMPNYLTDFEKWTSLVHQLFGKGKARPARK